MLILSFFFLEPSKGKVRNVTLLCGSLLLSQGAMISPQDLSVRLLCFNSPPLPVGLSGFRPSQETNAVRMNLMGMNGALCCLAILPT